MAATVAKTEELDTWEARARTMRAGLSSAAEDTKKAAEMETQWHQDEARRAAKARPAHAARTPRLLTPVIPRASSASCVYQPLPIFSLTDSADCRTCRLPLVFRKIRVDPTSAPHTAHKCAPAAVRWNAPAVVARGVPSPWQCHCDCGCDGSRHRPH